MKINLRLILLATLLIISGLGSLSIQASNNQNTNIIPNQVSASTIAVDYWTWDADEDRVDDIVEIEMTLTFTGLTGNNFTIFVEVYDANIQPNIYLRGYSDYSYQINSGAYYYHVTHKSEISGTLFFNVWIDSDGTWLDGQSFEVTGLDNYSEPSISFYSPVTFLTYDNDGDLIDDAISVDVDITTQNIVGTPYAYLVIYRDIGYWQYQQQNYRQITVDLANPNGQMHYDYHITQSGDYKFELWVYYDHYFGSFQLNTTYLFNGAQVDTNPPVEFWSGIGTYDSDGSPGIDAYDLSVNLDLNNFYGNVRVDVWAESHDGYWLGTWDKEFQASGTQLHTFWFSGVFTRTANYTFHLTVYVNGDLLRGEDLFADFVTPYVSPFALLQVNDWLEDYDDDLNNLFDTIFIDVELFHLNLLGEYQININIEYWDGVGYTFLRSEFWTVNIIDNLGRYYNTFSFNAPFDGDYRFETYVVYDGDRYTGETVFWNGASAYYGGEMFIFEPNWNVYDSNNDGSDDSINFENRFEYRSYIGRNIDVYFTVYLYDPQSGIYNYYTDSSYYNSVYGEGEFWIYFNFDSDIDGEFLFINEVYIDSELHDELTSEVYWYLYSAYQSNWDYGLDGFSQDQDGDNQDDYIQLRLHFNYNNLQYTDVEARLSVQRDGNQIHDDLAFAVLEGFGDTEIKFDFTSDVEGNYVFKVQLFANGEQIDTLYYDWYGYAYDPDHTLDNSNDTSSTPQLPVPAGSMYIFIIALFAAATSIRRKYN